MALSKKDRQIVFDKCNGRCAYCGEPLTKGWHADHVESLHRNFDYDKEKRKFVHDGTCKNPHNENIENYMPSCASCNITKSASSVEDFRGYIEQTIESLNHNRYASYKFAKRYGQLTEHPKPVIFYFETINNNTVKWRTK